MGSGPHLEKEEFLALIDQKAADWRAITQMSTAFLAFSGALFAAGVSQKASFIVVMAPIPLLFGVWHLAQNGAIQLEMVTYLDVFSPFESPTWEHDVAIVRPRVWQHLLDPNKARGNEEKLAAKVRRAWAIPSSWHVWLWGTLTVGCLVDLVPLLADGYHGAGWALLLGLIVQSAGVVFVWRRSDSIELKRVAWTKQWQDYRDELIRTRSDEQPTAGAAGG